MLEPWVETRAGKLRGSLENGALAFKGVPYAGVPSGRARFQTPPPLLPWAGIRDASGYGPRPWQIVQESRYPGFQSLTPMDEACLVLNVWTPALDGARRPVLVWHHGAPFGSGSGDSPNYNGANLARTHDAVVITVNHRLGALGYLYLAELGDEGFEVSGNAGNLDLVAALEWVRDEIPRFGGDPSKVMIFGESGGGAKVSTLFAMPKAHGLFQRAAMESGFRYRGRTRAAATRTAEQFLAELQITPSHLDDLFAVPPQQLIAAQAKFPRWAFGPVTDGAVLPIDPWVPGAAPGAAEIPLLIGANKDETTMGLVNNPSQDVDEATMRAAILDHLAWINVLAEEDVPKLPFERLIATYRRHFPSATNRQLQQVVTTDHLIAGSIIAAERKLAGGSAPVYMYRFDWETSAQNGVLKAVHGLEIPFVFENIERSPLVGENPQSRQLSHRVAAAWVAFARGGNPNHPDLPRCPASVPGRGATMLLNTESRIMDDPFGEERRALWEDLL